jgi:hypothetical protein
MGTVNPETKQLPTRWRFLEQGEGLQRATSTARVAGVVGFLLCAFVVFAIVYRLHPVAIALAAAGLGWVVAERNALRSRIAQWPILKRYINWKQVNEDSDAV